MFYFDAIIGLGAVPGALNVADEFLSNLVNPKILSCVAIWLEKACGLFYGAWLHP